MTEFYLNDQAWRAGTKHPAVPVPARTIEETGLPFLLLVESVAKVLQLRGQVRLTELSSHLKTSVGVIDSVIAFMRAEKLCEAVRRGNSNTDADLTYNLTETGRLRALEFSNRNAYAGPLPVPLDMYRRQVQAQSVSDMRVLREDIAREFDGIVIGQTTLDQLGTALNSGRAIFIHGPAGSGKTFLAERLSSLLKGDIWVPHALLVDGEIVQMYDPAVHHAVGDAAIETGSLDKRAQSDPRWVRCSRPTVLTGGELSLEMLELQFDPATRYYQAPPHLKANNGIFIIDDLGRQRCTPSDLMNRWIVPLDRHMDFLALHTGHKFMVPFDVIVVFSSNQPPQQLADGAFTRRIGYKIPVGERTEEEYERLVRQACDRLDVPWSFDGYQYLLREKHYIEGRPLLACYPWDIVRQVCDLARYENTRPVLDKRSIDWAWNNYFSAS
jgi:hypothetical protein